MSVSAVSAAFSISRLRARLPVVGASVGDANERASCSVRVLDTPTPSWRARDTAFYAAAVQAPDDAVMVQQERACASPIRYTP